MQVVIISLLALLLTSCAGPGPVFSNSKQLQDLPKPDNLGASLASPAPAAKPSIVKEYVPVAIPGQLRPIPKTKPTAAKNFHTKEEAVNYANSHAVVTPDDNNFFNAIMTYDYMPGALYTIYTAPLKITDIALEPEEKLISQSAGDTIRWQIAQTYSGETGHIQQHILVKPSKLGLENTVIITTNRRVYHLIFKSEENTYMVAVNWNYPQDMVQHYDGFGPGDEFDPEGGSSSGDKCPNINLSKIDANYTWQLSKGTAANWVPQQIFSSGRQTFIKFTKDFIDSNGQLPILQVASSQNKNDYATMTNWRFQCGYMIIDAIISKGRLVSGTDKKNTTVIAITKTS